MSWCWFSAEKDHLAQRAYICSQILYFCTLTAKIQDNRLPVGLDLEKNPNICVEMNVS